MVPALAPLLPTMLPPLEGIARAALLRRAGGSTGSTPPLLPLAAPSAMVPSLSLLPASLAAGVPPAQEAIESGLRRTPAAYRQLKQQFVEPEYASARELLLGRGDFGEWRTAKRLAAIPISTPTGVAVSVNGSRASPQVAAKPTRTVGRPSPRMALFAARA